MRLLHAFGLSLVWSGAALSFTGLSCATAAAQPSYRAAREATIAEFAAPRHDGFDKVIVQLPPLSPVRSAARPSAESPAAAAPAPTAAAARAAPAELVAAPAAAAPEAIRRDAPAEVGAAAPASEPPAVASRSLAPHAFAPDALAPDAVPPLAVAPGGESAPVAPPTAEIDTERAPVAAAPEAVAPVEMSAEPPLTAEPPVVAAEAPESAVIPAPASDDAQSAPPDAVAGPSPAMTEAAPVALDAPSPASAPAAEDDQDPGSWSWSLLTFVVALASLAGFALVRWRQMRGAASPPAAVPMARAAPTGEPARSRALLAFMRGRLAPALLAALQKLSKRKGSAARAGAEPEPAADWARIATTLRERAGSAVGGAPAREDADVVDAPAPKAETSRWEQDREDGVQLLEPGSNSARALVMNARRKLQAVGER